MTTNREWLFSLPLEEQIAWMESEHSEPNPPTDGIRELLDRQAAITAEETSNAWEEYRDATQREIAELTAERDELKAKVEELTTEAEKARPQRHPFVDLMIGALDSRGNELKLQERVEKLEAERDELQAQVGELRGEGEGE